MIDAEMPIVPVCGPVAIVSWGRRQLDIVPVSSLPAEIAQILRERGAPEQSSVRDVFVATAEFMRSRCAIHASPTCAVLPLRHLPDALQMLDRLYDSGCMYSFSEKLRVMPQGDVIDDLWDLISLGLISRDAAAKHIERQAKIWAKLERTLPARAMLARLGHPRVPGVDACRSHVIGPHMICKSFGPFERPIGGKLAGALQSARDDGLERAPEEVWVSAHSMVSQVWKESKVHLMLLSITGYAMWRAMISRRRTPPAAVDIFRRRVVDALLVPVGCESVRDAARCVWSHDPVDGHGLRYLGEQARIWREAWQEMQRETSPVVGGRHPASVA